MTARRGQAVVEVLAVAPLVAACVIGFALVAEQLCTRARAEALLGEVIGAQAAGTALPLAVRRSGARIVVRTQTVEVQLPGPLGEVRLRERRIG